MNIGLMSSSETAPLSPRVGGYGGADSSSAAEPVELPDVGVCAAFKQGFSCTRLNLSDFDAGKSWIAAFGTSRSAHLTDVYAEYRLALALAVTAIFTWALANDFVTCGNSDGKFLIHLTYWTLTLQLFYHW